MITLNLSQSIGKESAGEFTVYLLDNKTVAVEGLPQLSGHYSLEADQLVMTISNTTKSSPPNPFSATLYYGTINERILPPVLGGTAYGTNIQPEIAADKADASFVKLEWTATTVPFK